MKQHKLINAHPTFVFSLKGIDMTKLIKFGLLLTLLLSSCSSEYVFYSNRFFSEKELRTLTLDALPVPTTNGDTRLGIKSNRYAFYAAIDSTQDYSSYVNSVFTYLLTNSDITYVGYLVDAADLSSTVFVKHSDDIDDYQTNENDFLFYYTYCIAQILCFFKIMGT